MPIKLDIPFNEKEEVKKQGAWWLSKEKTWFIPDPITDLQPFAKWLPKEEGFIVRRPYFVARSEKRCWKCYEDTPLIAPGAKSFYALGYPSPAEIEWTKYDYPILFLEVDLLAAEVIDLFKKEYPFYRYTYSNTAKRKYWANTCVHCQALQGDNFNFSGFNAPFAPATKTDARLIKIEYLQLKYDYYIKAGFSQDVMYQWMFE